MKITAELTDEQAAHAKSVLPEAMTNEQARATLVEVASRAVSDQIWQWSVQRRDAKRADLVEADRAAHDAVWHPDLKPIDIDRLAAMVDEPV
jgi:hypothetical protein